jgi:glycosyltransferase involved in cell wall biosynthesis
MLAPTPFFADRGCHVRIYEEARALQALGHRVTICTYHNGRDLPGFDIRRIVRVPWYDKLEAGPSLHKIYLDFILLLKALRVARKQKPDVVHGHLHEGVGIGYILSRLLGIPLIGDYQGSLAGEIRAHGFLGNSRILFSLFRGIERLVDGLADVTIASCSEVAREMKEDFGVKQVHLALDGVDTEQFRPDVEAGELQSLVPSGRQAVVYLGLLNRYQGIDCLLEASVRVLQRRSDVHFLIMGYPNVEHFQQLAQSLEIADHVTFTGRVDYGQASRYLALGNVAVSPKISETESNGKLYNYMASGLPVVAFDTPVNREILGDLGIYAPLEDVKGLSDGILRALRGGEEIQSLKAQLRERAVRRFSWSATADRISRCYDIALGKA